MNYFFAALIVLSISSASFASDCQTDAYNATRSGTGISVNSHEAALQVANLSCSGQINLSDYTATRSVVNSHEAALEVAELIVKGRISLSNYAVTRSGMGPGSNSHEAALEAALKISNP
jgi:hypothetical protein